MNSLAVLSVALIRGHLPGHGRHASGGRCSTSPGNGRPPRTPAAKESGPPPAHRAPPAWGPRLAAPGAVLANAMTWARRARIISGGSVASFPRKRHMPAAVFGPIGLSSPELGALQPRRPLPHGLRPPLSAAVLFLLAPQDRSSRGVCGSLFERESKEAPWRMSGGRRPMAKRRRSGERIYWKDGEVRCEFHV